jgi:Holliday junction resolvasome RuvABC DNA-binding subunit
VDEIPPLTFAEEGGGALEQLGFSEEELRKKKEAADDEVDEADSTMITTIYISCHFSLYLFIYS